MEPESMKRPVTSKPTYGNWTVQNSHGVKMFRCSDKKANWYLKRNLAKIVEPQVLELTFTPKGVGHANDHSGYHLESKPNHCVVCGTKEKLTRHHVVPSCFRVCFPEEYKSRASFDVVVVCHECHDNYERIALALHNELREKAGCPQIKTQKDPNAYERLKLRRALNGLLNFAHKMPEERKLELQQLLNHHYGRVVPYEEYYALMIENEEEHIKGEKYGQKVVDQIENIFEFVVMWRKHFLEHAKPRFLSQSWIDHHTTVKK